MSRIQAFIALICIASVVLCKENSTSTSTSSRSNSDVTSTSSRVFDVTSTSSRDSGSLSNGTSSGFPGSGGPGPNEGSTSDKNTPLLTQRISGDVNSTGFNPTGDAPSSGGSYTSTSGNSNGGGDDDGDNGDDDDDDYPFYPYPGGDRWNGTKGDYNYTSNENGTYVIPGSFGGNITVTPLNQTDGRGHGKGGHGGDDNEDDDDNGEDENENEGSDRDYDSPLVYPNITTVKGCQFTGKNRNHTSGRNESYHVYDVNTIGQFRVALQYLQSGVNKNASLLGFALKAINVFEYNEVNGVRGYQVGDKITGSYDLSAASFDAIEIQSFDITSSVTGQENTLWKVTAQTSDEVFAVSITFAGIPIMVGDTRLSPDSMKIDVAIKWFTSEHVPASWTTGPSDAATYPHANVAVTIAAAASTSHSYFAETTPALNSTNPSVNFNGSDVNGFFSWEPTAFLNHGQSQTVVIASFGDATSYKSEFSAGYEVAAAFFSFPGDRPAYVLWDPEFGSAPAPTTTKASTTTTTSSVDNSSSVLYPIIALIALLIML